MKILAAFIVLFLAACSSQTVELRPQVAVQPFPGANGQLVTLAVRDERPSELIGVRGTNTRLGDINAADDVEGTISRTVALALEGAGFRVQGSMPSSARLVIDVRHLTFVEHEGLFTGKSVAEAAVYARVTSMGAIVFERLYRGSDTGRGVVVSSASSNAKHINAALTDALQKLASDSELLATLTSTAR